MELIQKFLLIQLLILVPLFGFAQVEVVSSTSSNKVHRISISHNGVSSFNVEIRGKIELTDDDKDV